MSDQHDTSGIERLQRLIGPDYQLRRIIGHGGMSTVWLADDTTANREVAVKVLRPEFSDNREFLDRFRNEALAAEKIESDNVVRTYDYREILDSAENTFCFIVMEYVPGESLADLLIRDGVIPEERALDIFEQVAHGLSVIHSMGMVHRDIKPGNILITESGSVKITDFGIAKAAAAVPLTRTGMVVGTAQYVSPEQAQGQVVTSASDVYSLGVVGYEMLAGRRPFNGDSSVSVAIAHINQAPPQLPQSISAPARELIGISLRKDPQRRFSDGHELEQAASTVRLGQRPPQPRASAAPATAIDSPAPAVQPETTLGHAVTMPPDVAPYMPTNAAGASAPQEYPPQQHTQAEPKKGNGGLVALVLVLIGTVAALLAWILYNSGVLGGTTGGETSTSNVPPVTEWVTTTVAPEPEETDTGETPQRTTLSPITTSETAQQSSEASSQAPSSSAARSDIDREEQQQASSDEQTSAPSEETGLEPIIDENGAAQ